MHMLTSRHIVQSSRERLMDTQPIEHVARCVPPFPCIRLSLDAMTVPRPKMNTAAQWLISHPSSIIPQKCRLIEYHTLFSQMPMKTRSFFSSGNVCIW